MATTKFLRRVTAEAAKSPNCSYHHGAIIHRGGKILYTGFNTADHCVHAETAALKRFCEKGDRQKNKEEVRAFGGPNWIRWKVFSLPQFKAMHDVRQENKREWYRQGKLFG
jgi:hypothetical protein